MAGKDEQITCIGCLDFLPGGSSVKAHSRGFVSVLQAALKAKKALQKLSWLDSKEDHAAAGHAVTSQLLESPLDSPADQQAVDDDLFTGPPVSQAPASKTIAKHGSKKNVKGKPAKVQKVKPVRKPRKGGLTNTKRAKPAGNLPLQYVVLWPQTKLPSIFEFQETSVTNILQSCNFCNGRAHHFQCLSLMCLLPNLTAPAL